MQIPIQNPFTLNLDAVIRQIEDFGSSNGAPIAELNLEGLIPKMIKGIAGCEHGCPADAKTLTSRGVKGFELEYIEGGILSAKATVKDKTICLKMFPDF